MKQFFVRDVDSILDQVIDSSFLIASKDLRPKRKSGFYLSLTLADRTGTVAAKVWDNVPELARTLNVDDFIRVCGRVNRYNGRPEIVVSSAQVLSESEVDPADYVPHTEADIEDLWEVLLHHVSRMENEYLRRLIEVFLDDEDVATKLRLAPAAKRNHHAWLGGLLEHVVSLCELSDFMVLHYPWLNRDLLIAGAVLHDIGKIYELTYLRSFGYSERGQLLGHISIGLEMLHARIHQVPEFPDELQTRLEHIILSHHGKLENGSPVEPRCPEALALHLIDNLDARLANISARSHTT